MKIIYEKSEFAPFLKTFFKTWDHCTEAVGINGFVLLKYQSKNIDQMLIEIYTEDEYKKSFFCSNLKPAQEIKKVEIKKQTQLKF